MAEGLRRPLLDLDILIRRPRIAIDGLSCELRHPDELTILGRQRLAGQSKRIQQLMAEETLPAAGYGDLERLVDEACRAVLIAPDETHRGLRDGQRMMVLNRFWNMLVESTPCREADGEPHEGDPGEFVPRLVRFYGCPPLDWLDRFPYALVRAHMEMLPRIAAEESLLWASRIAVGSASMDRPSRLAMIAEWELIAHYMPPEQSPQEQMEILKAVTLAMGGEVPKHVS